MTPAVETVDVLVVGSGFGGSITAARVAAPGRKVLVLEEGERWTGEKFRQSLDLRYFLSVYRGHGDLFDRTRSPRLLLRSLVEHRQGGGVIIMRGKGVGGGSLIYSNIHLRAPSLCFDLADDDGRRLWPDAYSRAALDPYYTRVEEILHVRQLGWNEVSRRAQVLGEGLRRVGRRLDPIRVALVDCKDCGFCTVGCKFDRKQSLYLNYIPEAEARGVVFRPQAKARALVPRPDGSWRVLWDDLASGHRRREIDARTLVLAAGPIATPVLLLRSKANLKGLSPHVGEHLSLTADAGFGAVVPDFVVDGYRGKIISTICYSYLRESGFVFEDLHYLPLASAVSFPTAAESASGPGPVYWGAENKALLRHYGRNVLSVGMMGIDRNEGRVTLDVDGDARLHWAMTPHTQRVYDAAREAWREIVRALGGQVLKDQFSEEGGVATVHPLATCRMADRKEAGVVDPDGQVWGHPNLYVIDGSIVPTSVAVNPSHTIAAIAERLAERLAARLDGAAALPH
ncbi:MAG: GMC family oxidoreductase [Acidobacteriota bacterium]